MPAGVTVTRQAVWPQELLDRREAATAMMAALRRVQLEAAAAGCAGLHEILELRSQLEALPCPHWDVHQDAGGPNDWTCSTCAAVIAPEWVPLGEQERHLRRLHGRRTPSRGAGHARSEVA